MNSETNEGKSYFETNDLIVVAEYGDHDYSDKVSNVAAVEFSQKLTTTRTRLFRSGWCCFFGLSLLPSGEVGSAFANEIISTIPDEDRCRKFADYTVDTLTPGVILHLTYGLQVLNRVRQPMQLRHSIPI